MSATKHIDFYSDGIRLSATLYLPDNCEQPPPVVMVCSGLHGLKTWVPERWRPHIVAAGFACFAFDYRGFGASDGERGHLRPREEIEDVLNAITCLRCEALVDSDRIALLGWGLGAGVALCAAVRDKGVACLVCANGAGDYGRATKTAVSEIAWNAWQTRLEVDRCRRVAGGESERVDYRNLTNPGVIESFAVHDQFFKDLGEIGERPNSLFSLASCDAYLDFRPQEVVSALSPRPLLIVHGEENYFMPASEARSLFAMAGKCKDLWIIKGGRHLEMIDPDYPGTADTMQRVVTWIGANLHKRPL